MGFTKQLIEFLNDVWSKNLKANFIFSTESAPHKYKYKTQTTSSILIYNIFIYLISLNK